MIEYKKIKKDSFQERAIVCDACKKRYDAEKDVFELDEFVKINKVGGYDSVFGDGNKIQLDICQHCLKEIFKGKIRVSQEYHVL